MYIGPFPDAQCSNGMGSVRKVVQKPVEVERGWTGVQCEIPNCQFVHASAQELVHKKQDSNCRIQPVNSGFSTLLSDRTKAPPERSQTEHFC